MELIKFSVFFLTVVIYCNATRRSPLHRIGDGIGQSNPANSGCICFPEAVNGQPLSNMIDSTAGMERLVTYFYVDPETRKVTAYTPNIEKQQAFPDIPFEDGDDIQSLQTENIQNFVLMNHNKIERPFFGHDSVSQLTIDANLNPIDSVSNKHHIIVSGSESINVPQGREISLNTPLNFNVGTNEPMNQVLSTDNINVDIKPNIDTAMVGNINLDSLDLTSIMKQLIPADETVGVTYQGVKQMPEHLADGYVLNWNDYVVNPKTHKVDVQNIQTPGYFKFDQWFQKQMDSSLNKQIQNSVNFPDNDVLKNLVYKNLFQNGLITVDNGILKTQQGDTLNLSNLKLQPVLIGLSLGYKYPTTTVQDKIVSPHYDAMVLYTNNPQKILGIIPMSSGFASSAVAYNTMNVKKVYPSLLTSTIVKTHCVNGKCTTTTTDKDYSSRSSRPQEEQGIHDHHDMYGHSDQDGRKRIHVYHAGIPLTLRDLKRLERQQKKRKSKRIPVTNDLLEQLYNIILGDNVKNSGKKSPAFEVSTIEDEGPDFRIVGGSAATGSGTPVSSRGRSGYE